MRYYCSVIDSTLLAVFLVGLLGGIHCAGMCGGIVSALGMLSRGTAVAASEQPLQFHRHARHPASHASRLASLLAYNGGRITTYTALGALAGGVGSAAWLLQTWLPVQQTAFVITNLVLILMGLYIMGVRAIATRVEAAGAMLWRYVQPLAGKRLLGNGVFNALVAGGLWGLVPCGMVYGVLLSALSSGSAAKGAGLMLVFGLGTLPNLMLLGTSGQWLAAASRNRPVRLAVGMLIMLFGVLGLLRINIVEKFAAVLPGAVV